MHESLSLPTRPAFFFGLYLAESLCWSTGASCLPDGPPGEPTGAAPPDRAAR